MGRDFDTAGPTGAGHYDCGSGAGLDNLENFTICLWMTVYRYDNGQGFLCKGQSLQVSWGSGNELRLTRFLSTNDCRSRVAYTDFANWAFNVPLFVALTCTNSGENADMKQLVGTELLPALEPTLYDAQTSRDRALQDDSLDGWCLGNHWTLAAAMPGILWGAALMNRVLTNTEIEHVRQHWAPTRDTVFFYDFTADVTVQRNLYRPVAAGVGETATLTSPGDTAFVRQALARTVQWPMRHVSGAIFGAAPPVTFQPGWASRANIGIGYAA